MRARAATTVVFFATGGIFASWASRIPAVQERLDLSAGELAIAILGIEGGAVLGLPLGGALTTRIGSRWTLRIDSRRTRRYTVEASTTGIHPRDGRGAFRACSITVGGRPLPRSAWNQRPPGVLVAVFSAGRTVMVVRGC